MDDTFHGAAILSFESRQADTMARNIALHGGLPVSAPCLQEVPFLASPDAEAFSRRLLGGEIDVFIFMTGVGTRILLDLLSSGSSAENVTQAIRRTTVVARGPKPILALRERGIPATITVPEPNTWAEVVQAIDFSGRSAGLDGRTVAIQEYGSSNRRLIQALEQRGARVIPVAAYRWALPEDTGPLLEGIRRLIAGEIRAVLFTNAEQVRQLVGFAAEKEMEIPLREAMKKTVVSSIGPNTSDALMEHGLCVDFESSHPKMGILVSELASRLGSLTQSKGEKPQTRLSPRAREVSGSPRDRRESPFLKACRREEAGVTPIWLMRQAGRYMKEYQEIRRKVPFLELCKNKELVAEVTVHAAKKIKADAAILFSDILVVVEPLGLGLEYTAQDGPVISGQVASLADVDRLAEIEPEESLRFVFDSVRLTRASLDPKVPLIGFSGAPFTLASYVIEGGSSKSFFNTKKLMITDPGAWNALMEKISRGLVKYLNGQIEAGADAVQLFDSWVGCLAPEDYRRFVLPHTRSVIRGIRPGVPVIHFGTGTAGFLSEMREAGGDVIGVDFRVRLDEAWQCIGHDASIQGNLDPVVLCGPTSEIRRRVKEILNQAANRPGHIFNLGHGVLPYTPVENVIALVEMVHELSRRPG